MPIQIYYYKDFIAFIMKPKIIYSVIMKYIAIMSDNFFFKLPDLIFPELYFNSILSVVNVLSLLNSFPKQFSSGSINSV